MELKQKKLFLSQHGAESWANKRIYSSSLTRARVNNVKRNRFVSVQPHQEHASMTIAVNCVTIKKRIVNFNL